MKSIATIISLTASLLTLAFAAPAPGSIYVTEHGTSDKFNGTEPAKRDTCGSGYPYTVSDMDALISALQSDGQTDYNPGGLGQWVSHTYVTARICIYNNYLYENTHVSHWEDGWAAGYIAGECCTGGNPVCAGGSCTAHGDSGLSVIVATQNSADAC